MLTRKVPYTDSLEMKVFLIFHLLLSISMDFDVDSALYQRFDLALRLTRLAAREYEERAKWTEKHPNATSYFKDSEWDLDKASKLRELQKEIEGFEPFEMDGRYFRDEFPHGYIGMLEYFGLWEEEEQ